MKMGLRPKSPSAWAGFRQKVYQISEAEIRDGGGLEYGLGNNYSGFEKFRLWPGRNRTKALS